MQYGNKVSGTQRGRGTPPWLPTSVEKQRRPRLSLPLIPGPYLFLESHSTKLRELYLDGLARVQQVRSSVPQQGAMEDTVSPWLVQIDTKLGEGLPVVLSLHAMSQATHHHTGGESSLAESCSLGSSVTHLEKFRNQKSQPSLILSSPVWVGSLAGQLGECPRERSTEKLQGR